MFVAGTCLPPLLPTVFVVSVGISCKRLSRKRITCTDSTGILVAGKVKKAFFDKTGTLTEQGLRFVSAQKGDELGKSATNGDGEVVIDSTLQLGLSCCHTLTANANGELIGPAVDRMGFSAIESASLFDEHSVKLGDQTIKYLKRFEFDHHSMTQSVIVQHGDEKLVFVKGSPEAISKLCLLSSLPDSFADHARFSARNGYVPFSFSYIWISCSSKHELTLLLFCTDSIFIQNLPASYGNINIFLYQRDE